MFVRDLGLSPLQAIQAATSEAARAIGRHGETGAIAPGRLADLILVDGDPAQDVRVLGDRQRIKRVLIGGREQALQWPGPNRGGPTRMAGFHLRQPNSTPQLDRNALTLKSR